MPVSQAGMAQLVNTAAVCSTAQREASAILTVVIVDVALAMKVLVVS